MLTKLEKIRSSDTGASVIHKTGFFNFEAHNYLLPKTTAVGSTRFVEIDKDWVTVE